MRKTFVTLLKLRLQEQIENSSIVFRYTNKTSYVFGMCLNSDFCCKEEISQETADRLKRVKPRKETKGKSIKNEGDPRATKSPL